MIHNTSISTNYPPIDRNRLFNTSVNTAHKYWSDGINPESLIETYATAPDPKDMDVIEKFEFALGETRIVMKNATKDLIESITNIMLKERNDEENKPTEYSE